MATSVPWWDRYARVIIKDRQVEGLRVAFRVKKNLAPTPNSLDLRVYNLAEATRAALEKQHVPIVLVAGYKKNAEVIFSGTSKTVDHGREGADWVTHVQCGDGEHAFRGFSAFSFAAGARLVDVLARIAKDMGLNAGDAIAKIRRGDLKAARESYIQGYVASGRSVRELDRVLKAAGLQWSIQDGNLQVLKPGDPTQESVLLLSPTTGLVGSPESKLVQKPMMQDKIARLAIRSLLNGGIRPGRLVMLQSKARSGYYVVEEVEHTGDLRGQDWTTTLEGRPR